MSSFPTRSLTERFYHPELDVLRFLAFFLVFLHHSLPHETSFYTNMGTSPILASILAGIGNTGAFGVNLFFVLSSYLITELLIRERQRFGHVDLRAFYIRRILRIWPLYFAYIAFAWILQWYVPNQHIGWRAGLAFCLLGGNWWVVFVGFPSSIIFPLWSVSVEEQFYIFWPVTMRRLSQRGLLIASAVMLVIANVTRWYLAAHHTWESKIWANTFVQFDAIALGILLAAVLAGRAPRLGSLHRIALFAAGIACFAVAGNYFQIKVDPLSVPRVLLGYPVVALGAVALFLAALHQNPEAAGGPQPRARDRSGVDCRLPGCEAVVGESGIATQPVASWRTWLMPPLVYLGRISYSLYVFHVVGLMITDYTIRHQDTNLPHYLFRNAVALAITVAFAAVSYRWVEMPFLSLKQRFTHIVSRPGG
ncbi:MAG: acyltransferase [Candidatus Korobacteraceae bacterium]